MTQSTPSLNGGAGVGNGTILAPWSAVCCESATCSRSRPGRHIRVFPVWRCPVQVLACGWFVYPTCSSVVRSVLAAPVGAPPFSTSSFSWSGVFLGVVGNVVDVVVVVCELCSVVVVFAGFTKVLDEPAVLVSTRCNKKRPTMTARPINAAPFTAAALAPRAKSPLPPDGRLISPFCPNTCPRARLPGPGIGAPALDAVAPYLLPPLAQA